MCSTLALPETFFCIDYLIDCEAEIQMIVRELDDLLKSSPAKNAALFR